jgi:lysozyme
MRTSQNGLNLIQASEGLCLTVKPDNKGPQIGYGHDLQPGESYPNGITESQALALLQADLATRYERAVNPLAPDANQNQFDALVDFCYNLGPGDLATMLNHGFDQVPKQRPA